ncbi:hypothetical protein FACS189492_0430 [Clostridia bacterium]|nr:hypothetical protein FACS189492_0430 [Clostridia bacterium]
MATQRITFCKFKTTDAFNSNKMITSIQEKNADDRYFVFNEQGTTYIRGSFYIERQQSDHRYNIISGEVEEIPFVKQVPLKFEIDISGQTIMIWGNRKFVPDLLTELSIASENSVVMDEINVDFKKAVEKVAKTASIKISKMKILNVPIEAGILATCTVDASALESPQSFIKKYIDNVIQISITINDDYLDDGETTAISVTLYSSGSLVVYKDRDSISDETIDMLKSLIA